MLDGVIEILQEAVTLPAELTTGWNDLDVEVKEFIAITGVNATAVTVVSPEIALPVLKTLTDVIMVLLSTLMIADAIGDATGTYYSDGTIYEKARAYGRDAVLLLLAEI